jgi:hypothetical protein
MPRANSFYCPETKFLFEIEECENPLCGVETVGEMARLARKGLTKSECMKLGVREKALPETQLFYCNELGASCCESCCNQYERLFPKGLPSWK